MNNKRKFNLIQRVVFFIGLIVLIGLISTLVFEMTQENKNPPVLEISTSHQPMKPNNSYQVWIQNLGEETAENARVLLKLYQGGKHTESGTVFTKYVPPGSKAEAWIVFHTDSKPDDSLVVSSVTYVLP